MKRLFLLFIPLMFFFGCEVFDEDDESNDIVGTWRNNIEGGWRMTGHAAFFIWQEFLLDGSIDVSYTEGFQCMSLLPESDGMELEDCTFSNLQVEYILQMMYDRIERQIDLELETPNPGLFSFSNGGGCWYMDDWLDYVENPSNYAGTWQYLLPSARDEMITFYENGDFTYQVSPLSMNTDSLTNLALNDEHQFCIGDIFTQGSANYPFEISMTGTWSLNGGVLTLNEIDANDAYSYSVELDGDNLTLDRSLTGNEEYITTWEKQ